MTETPNHHDYQVHIDGHDLDDADVGPSLLHAYSDVVHA